MIQQPSLEARPEGPDQLRFWVCHTARCAPRRPALHFLQSSHFPSPPRPQPVTCLPPEGPLSTHNRGRTKIRTTHSPALVCPWLPSPREGSPSVAQPSPPLRPHPSGSPSCLLRAPDPSGPPQALQAPSCLLFTPPGALLPPLASEAQRGQVTCPQSHSRGAQSSGPPHGPTLSQLPRGPQGPTRKTVELGEGHIATRPRRAQGPAGQTRQRPDAGSAPQQAGGHSGRTQGHGDALWPACQAGDNKAGSVLAGRHVPAG